MRKLRIGSVGVGPRPGCRSERHMEVIQKLSDMYELCALCDKDEHRLREAGETFGVKALYTNLDDMLRQEKPDVAYRLTPKDSMTPINVRIAESKVHVLTEIPIGLTLPTADIVIDACRRNNVKMEIAENVWVWPAEQLKQKIARAGLIGKMTHARVQYPCGSYHGFNGIRMILGAEPKRVLGYTGQVDVMPQKAYAGTLMTRSFWEAGIIEFPDEVRLLYEMPPKGRQGPFIREVQGTHGYLPVDDRLVRYEDGKEVTYPFEREYEEIGGERVVSKLRVDTDPPVVWENPFKSYGIGNAEGIADHGWPGSDNIAKASILASMYHAVVEDAEPVYGVVNARRDLEMWVAVCESAERGNVWIDLPLTEVTQFERRIHDAYRERYGHDPIEDIAALTDVSFPRGGVLWDVSGWL